MSRRPFNTAAVYGARIIEAAARVRAGCGRLAHLVCPGLADLPARRLIDSLAPYAGSIGSTADGRGIGLARGLHMVSAMSTGCQGSACSQVVPFRDRRPPGIAVLAGIGFGWVSGRFLRGRRAVLATLRVLLVVETPLFWASTTRLEIPLSIAGWTPRPKPVSPLCGLPPRHAWSLRTPGDAVRWRTGRKPFATADGERCLHAVVFQDGFLSDEASLNGLSERRHVRRRPHSLYGRVREPGGGTLGEFTRG